jgi:catechol 2,3-dioxygenase-like lactoylglutathione lyase family enzyme
MLFEHVGLAVTDLQRSIDFYTRVFGFKLLRKTTINAYLYFGEDLLELIQASEMQSSKLPQSESEWRTEMMRHIGLNHIGFRVSNLDEAIARIEKRGGTLVVGPFRFRPEIEQISDTASDKLARAVRPRRGTTWRIAVFADPDGTMLELLER